MRSFTLSSLKHKCVSVCRPCLFCPPLSASKMLQWSVFGCPCSIYELLYTDHLMWLGQGRKWGWSISNWTAIFKENIAQGLACIHLQIWIFFSARSLWPSANALIQYGWYGLLYMGPPGSVGARPSVAGIFVSLLCLWLDVCSSFAKWILKAWPSLQLWWES